LTTAGRPVLADKDRFSTFAMISKAFMSLGSIFSSFGILQQNQEIPGREVYLVSLFISSVYQKQSRMSAFAATSTLFFKSKYNRFS
jgi:hypothetical protein